MQNILLRLSLSALILSFNCFLEPRTLFSTNCFSSRSTWNQSDSTRPAWRVKNPKWRRLCGGLPRMSWKWEASCIQTTVSFFFPPSAQYVVQLLRTIFSDPSSFLFCRITVLRPYLEQCLARHPSDSQPGLRAKYRDARSI